MKLPKAPSLRFARVTLLIAASSHGWAATTQDDVRAVLERQTAAWNRGDLKAFVDDYDDSAVFVGKEVARGKIGVLDRYLKNYGTAEKRGQLRFTNLEVKPLGPDYASVIGRFHLERSPAGGGNADGIFTLLFHKGPKGWKIILDHTS